MKRSRIKTAVQALLRPAVLALYPRRCVCCGRLIDESEWLCLVCYRKIERTDAEKRCLSCGQEKSRCVCKSRAFYFKSVIAPFYHTGLARRALYAYKLGARRHYAAFFAGEMAKSVRMEYAGLRFDGVCFVPTSARSLRRRGFDQAAELAYRTAELLGLPVCADILCCRRDGEEQHTLSAKERLSAARKRYSFENRADGLRLLLVDDIMTTGSTLDACAHQLLLAGAESVCCVTALIARAREAKKNPTAVEKSRHS